MKGTDKKKRIARRPHILQRKINQRQKSLWLIFHNPDLTKNVIQPYIGPSAGAIISRASRTFYRISQTSEGEISL